MKIALITDQHFGARDDDQNFDRFFERFYTEVFFPYLIKHNITKVIGLGDMFDRRKYVNYVTLSRAREYYFDWYEMNGVEKWNLIGNHDVFYKNTNTINSPDLLLKDYKNQHIIQSACELEFDGVPIFMLPWINSENREQVEKMVAETRAQILFGHLELDGFEMYRGVRGTGQDNPHLYSKFDLVCSGHYHHKSTNGNINYLGAPYEMNWLDFNDSRGFHVFDTETRTLEYIENPIKMFAHYYYDDSKVATMEEILPKPGEFTGKYVKVIVIQKTKPQWFDHVIPELENSGTFKIQVVEDHHNMHQVSETELLEELGDTFHIIKSYIKGTESQYIPELEVLFEDLYVQVNASS